MYVVSSGTLQFAVVTGVDLQSKWRSSTISKARTALNKEKKKQFIQLNITLKNFKNVYAYKQGIL